MTATAIASRVIDANNRLHWWSPLCPSAAHFYNEPIGDLPFLIPGYFLIEKAKDGVLDAVDAEDY